MRIFLIIILSTFISFESLSQSDYDPTTPCEQETVNLCNELYQNTMANIEDMYMDELYDMANLVGECINEAWDFSDLNTALGALEFSLNATRLGNLLNSMQAVDCADMAWKLADDIDDKYGDRGLCADAVSDHCLNSNGCEIDPDYMSPHLNLCN